MVQLWGGRSLSEGEFLEYSGERYFVKKAICLLKGDSVTDVFKKIVEACWFQNLILITILAAGVLVGVQTYEATSPAIKALMPLFDILDKVILWIFVVEIIVKMGAEGARPWRYFFDSWNVFDFTIVAVCFLPFGAGYTAVLRLLRLLRVLKLVRALPRLQVLVGALLKSLPGLAYVSILLGLIFYVYACAAVFLFGANDPIHFGHLPIAMLSLFRVVTGEDWTDLMYIAMKGCANYGYIGSESLCTHSESMPVLAAFFFVSFMMIGAMIILNLFIGVIMTGMEEASVDVARDRAKELEESGGPTREDRMAALVERLDSIHKEFNELMDKKTS